MSNKIMKKLQDLQISIGLNDNAYDDDLEETWDNINSQWNQLKILMNKKLKEPRAEKLVNLENCIICLNDTNTKHKLIDRDGWACCSAYCLSKSNRGSHIDNE